MDLEIIGRHLDITDAIRDHVTRRADKVQKFFDRIHSLKTVIDLEGGHHQVELIAHLIKGNVVVAKVTGADVYATVDAAADKLEAQLKRYKEKLREHRAKAALEPVEGEEAPEEPEL